MFDWTDLELLLLEPATKVSFFVKGRLTSSFLRVTIDSTDFEELADFEQITSDLLLAAGLSPDYASDTACFEIKSNSGVFCISISIDGYAISFGMGLESY
jgi:hypothetical protein